MNVVAYVPDLLDRSRIQGAVRGTAVALRFVATLEDLAATEADVVVLDLSRPGVLDAIRGLTERTRVVGFAPHVDRDTVAAARAAGCDALPRSAFFARTLDVLRPAP